MPAAFPAFSIIAGVDPRVGLFSSFVMAVAIAFLGGRPAMITAATGAIALVIAPVAREYGMDYFIATVILAGLFQIVLALLGVAKLMRFIPRSVMTGFVNALAHSKDAWAIMPEAIWLSSISALLAFVAAWIGFSGIRTER